MNEVNNISATEAYKILEQDADAILIDVRTIPEWSFVGLPNLSSLSKDVHKISWLFYPSMEVNKNFIEQLSSVTSDKTQKLVFLCKVGGRSYDAALTALGNGYENCYNIVGGFEGDLDESGKRGNINGWKAENLPWVQV